MAESPYLFVYGTLRSAAATERSRWLAGNAQPAGSGRVSGVLFQLDGYPGLVPTSGENEWVVGELFCLTEPASFWPALDEYEKCGPADPAPHEFDRRILPVEMDDGRRLNAWVYVYCRDASEKPRIQSGDYLQSR
jgi:gamma-glutamylcyclotransferase (GGCT)/AIG2-like uncharacterized protein YtfP